MARVAALTALMRPDGGAAHLRREAEVATLSGGGRRAGAGPEPVLPAGPHERDGRWMTFWPHVDHDESRAISVEEAAALLRQVHDALAGYAGELPLVAPVLVEVPQIIATLEEQGAVSASDADALRGAWSALAPELEALGPIQALHGDAHVGNMLVPRGGEPLWSDFEDACAGPVAWDLACLRFHSSTFGDAALEATASGRRSPARAVPRGPRGCSPRHGRASRRSGGLSSRSEPRLAWLPTASS